MPYRCICGTYVFEPLKLCSRCAAKYGNDYKAWTLAVRLLYNDLNFGGDYQHDLTRVRPTPLGRKGNTLQNIQDPVFGKGETVRRRCPICQEPIKAKWYFCKEHYEQYRGDPKRWPVAVRELVDMEDKRLYDAKHHRDPSIDDETFGRRQATGRPGTAGGGVPGSGGKRTSAQYNQFEISKEAVDWSDDLGGGGDDSTLPGYIKGDRSGIAFNKAAWQGSNGYYSEIVLNNERDALEDKIAAEQELSRWDATTAAALLLHYNGWNQTAIGKALNLPQQRVSEILSNSVKSA